MEFLDFYGPQILTACGVGIAIGLIVKCRWVWFLPIVFVASGIITLAVTGDWKDFLKDGFTIVHLIYLAGHCVISLIYFGPFGAISGTATRFLKSCLVGRGSIVAPNNANH